MANTFTRVLAVDIITLGDDVNISLGKILPHCLFGPQMYVFRSRMAFNFQYSFMNTMYPFGNLWEWCHGVICSL